MIEIAIHKSIRTPQGKIPLLIDCKINEGECVAFYGASGVGKTCLLHCIAGITQPDSGKLQVGNNIWYDSDNAIDLSPQKRNINLVFQDYVLFPNMTVRQNIEYGLSKNQNTTIVDELLKVMELTTLAHQKPKKLSGGQKQRVALARALANQPKLLLLDEAFSALDITIKTKLQDYILDYKRKNHTTIIMVSHQIEEVQRLADRAFIIEQGKIVKQGDPATIFSNENFFEDITIKGTVIDCIQIEDQYYIKVNLLDANKIHIPIHASDINTYQTGELITINGKLNSLSISKA